MDHPSSPQLPSNSRMLQLCFGALALLSVAIGLCLHLFSGQLGIDPLNADKITFAFTLAGAIDALVVHFWEDLIQRLA